MPTDIVLQNVVVRYPHLAEPWTGRPSIPADYQVRIILPQNWPQWEALQAAVNEAITQKFGANVPPHLKMPWLNTMLQPAIEDDGPYQGCYYLNAKGKGTKPAVVGTWAGPDGQVEAIPDAQIKQMIFSGCVCNVYVNFGGYQEASVGVGCYLKSVQLVNNQVEPIADAGQDPSAVFQAIPGAPAPITPAQPFSPQDPLTVKPPQGAGW